METVDFHHGECPFALKTRNGCVCEYIHHHLFAFGSQRDPLYEVALFDKVNYVSKDNLHYRQKVEDDGCSCDYCVYRKNVRTDTFVPCFCCKEKLYLKQVEYCSDCNVSLCHRCFVRGRYNDPDNQVCYDCRSFGPHKNAGFYGDGYGYATDKDQWDHGTWYY
jgi:hypothetical protein